VHDLAAELSKIAANLASPISRIYENWLRWKQAGSDKHPS
jgi:hypothetical protein